MWTYGIIAVQVFSQKVHGLTGVQVDIVMELQMYCTSERYGLAGEQGGSGIE